MTPGDGDPVAAGLHVAIMRRDAAAVRETLAAYAGDELSTLISTATRSQTGAYTWLRAERGNMGDDPLMLTLLGSATVNYAWHLRTSYGAQHVSRQQFAGFHGALREAEEHLYRAVELDPESAAPWAHLVTSGRGLQLGLEVIERRFEAAVQRCPNHRIAHQQMLQALCGKWFGSHDRMHAFAAEAAKGPHAASLAHLVAIAHLEHWLGLGTGQPRSSYMKDSTVRAQLEEAADASLFRPGYSYPRSPHSEANVFAMAFSLAGMHGPARRAFDLTNGVVTAFPWRYINGRDQVMAFTNRRRAAQFARFA
jgi:hypothetical protein